VSRGPVTAGNEVRAPGAAEKAAAPNRFWRILRQNWLALFGLTYIAVVGALVLLEPVLPLPSAYTIDLRNRFAPPSAQHWLGTDENGRDVLARLIAGGRVSFAVATAGAILTVAIAALVGVVAGYAGGAVDQVLMRFTDGMMSVPTFFLLMVILTLWGSSATVLIVALATTRWMGVSRLVRAEVLRFKSMDFITASRGLGAGSVRIMFVQLLPQAMPSLVVATTINVGIVMLVEAGLSFLGIGVLPPTPSWGNMLGASQYYMWSAPRLAVYPGMMILLSVMSFNALGDVIRDALDPRARTGAAK
jgi:peptide/nickel transport system permease protein